MTATLLIGPAASGKTQSCIEAIRQLRADHAIAPAWAVQPDRAQSVEFRRRLAAAGGVVGTRVETMDALVEEILMRSGGSRPRVSQLVARRLIGTILSDLAREGELEHYGPIANAVGLTRAIQDRLGELTLAGVGPAELLAYAQDARKPGMIDIAKVFAAYRERLVSLGWGDPSLLMGIAAGALSKSPGLLGDVRLVVLDGFDVFHQLQIDLLSALAKATDVLITLTGESERERRALARSEATRHRLIEAIPQLSVEELAAAGGMEAGLSSLEQGIFEKAERTEASEQVTFLRARSRQQEVREALRWLKARILRDGISPAACAVLLSDPEQDTIAVSEIAREFGLPIRLRHGQPLEKAPVVVSLLALLDSPRLDWPRRLTIEVIRNPYLHLAPLGLGPEDATALEAASYWGQVVGGLDQWVDALDRLAGRSQAQELEEPSVSGALLPSPAEASQLLTGLRELIHRATPPSAQSVHDWVQWLEDLLEDFGFLDTLRTSEEQAAALRTREVLRALVLAEAAVGPLPIRYGDFVRELRSSIESARFQPRSDWRQAAVQVMSVDSASGLRFKAVAVVGLSEGQLPRIERADPFLDESAREALHLEPRLGRQQESTFYNAITRADRRLLLTRATLAEDGETWHPSPYWSAALSVFGIEDDDIDSVRPGQPRPFSEACSPQEVSFLAVRRHSLPKAYDPLAHRLLPLRRAREVLAARSQLEAGSPFEGGLQSVSEVLSELFHEDRVWSPSRLESYTSCPHLFFVGQLLGVEPLEPPALGPDARQLGSLLHSVLERAYRSAEDPTNTDSVLTQLEEIAGEELQAAPETYGFRPSPLWNIESDHLLQALVRTVQSLAEEGENWRPFAFEQRFGLDGHEPLTIETGEGQIRVRGIVDRLDVRDGEIRVIDYKTGSSHLSSADLITGRRLQLPLYALAAERALGLGQVVDGFYWAILSARRGSLRLASFRGTEYGSDLTGPRAAYQQLTAHLERFLTGGRQGAFPPVPPAGGCPAYCPAAGWCWRYSPGYRG